jgi:hypothetical protein
MDVQPSAVFGSLTQSSHSRDGTFTAGVVSCAMMIVILTLTLI